jgi:hypothetical protein
VILTASIQTKMILWTLVLAVGLGLLAFGSWLSPVVPLESHFGSAVSSKGLRAPASTSDNSGSSYAMLPLDQSNLIQAVDFTVSCLPEVGLNGAGLKKSKSSTKASAGAKELKSISAVFAPSVKQIRLSGSICTPKAELVKSEIENESNGFSATVFVQTPRSYTSDYISLTAGPNRLRIKNVYKDGSIEDRELVIERGPANQRTDSQNE